MNEQKKQLEEVISNIENKNFGFYFFVLDTKGNPTAGVANIYEHVRLLNKLGYNAYILHEKNDYRLRGNQEGMGISDWLGEEYAELPHVSIEAQQLNVGAKDFIIIPEVFANIMDQVKSFPCKRIVLSQSFEYSLELLPIGRRWTDYGFNDVITTSERQAHELKTYFPSIKTHIVPVSIPSYFKAPDKPKIPVVSIVTREPGAAAKIAKKFYLQFPMYKWITFKELRGMPRKVFADELSKSCLAVWVDDLSGFGTFPLECMQTDTPVIGKMPNMIPEWMEEKDSEGNPVIKNNGIWSNTTLNIPELISKYLKLWLEDSVPSELLESMESSKNMYTEENQEAKIKEVYGLLVENRINEFQGALEKITNLETEKA